MASGIGCPEKVPLQKCTSSNTVSSMDSNNADLIGTSEEVCKSQNNTRQTAANANESTKDSCTVSSSNVGSIPTTTTTQNAPPSKKKKKVLVMRKKTGRGGPTVQPGTSQMRHSTPSKSATTSSNSTNNKNGSENENGIFNMLSLLPSLTMMMDPGRIQKKLDAIPQEQIEKLTPKEVLNQLTSDFLPSDHPMSKLFNTVVEKSQQNFFPNAVPSSGVDSQQKPLGESTGQTGGKKETQVSGNTGFPSVFDAPPEKPLDKDRKYPELNAKGKKSQNRKELYKMFNQQLMDLLSSLAVQLPDKKKLYDTLARTMNTYIDADPEAALERWKKSVKDHEPKLRVYSVENVEYICKNLPKMELLCLLELENEWHRFTSVQLQQFHAKLKALQNTADLLEDLPEELLDNVGMLAGKFGAPIRDQIKEGKSAIQVGQFLAEHVFEEPEVLSGFQKVASDVTSALMSNNNVPPPSVSAFIQRANQTLAK